ncbi:MAG: hypothetical protein AABX52_02750 [Nanoarchaeota archaeon]
MRILHVIVVIMLLGIVPSVFAVWDPQKVKFSEGFSESIGPFLVRFDEVDSVSKSAFVTVLRKGVILASSPITTRKPLVLPGKIMVELEGFSKVYSYGNVAVAQVSLWVDGKIVSWRFPKVMSTRQNILYNAYMVVENTGVVDASFSTEIVQEGVYLPSKDKYQLEDGTEVSRLLDVTQPIHTLLVRYGEVVRTDYKEIAGNQRQHRGASQFDRSGGIFLNLMYKNVLVDSVYIPDFALTPVRSAGILDVLVPDTMSSDNAYEAVAELMSAGGSFAGSSERSKFNLELQTKGFELGSSQMEGYGKNGGSVLGEVTPPDIIRGKLVDDVPQQWRFTIKPHVAPGEYVLNFVLSGRKDGSGTNMQLDHIEIPVTVRKGFLTRIESVKKPDAVSFKGVIPLIVRVNNVGLGRLVELRLKSPLLETTLKKLVSLPGYAMTDVFFDVPALSTGSIPFSVELYTHYAFENKNFDPSGDDQYLLDAKQFVVSVPMPGAEDVQVVSKVSQPVGVVKSDDFVDADISDKVVSPPLAPAVVVDSDLLQPILPPTPLVKQEAVMQSEYVQYLPWVLGGVAVLLVIAGLRIVWDAYHVEEEIVPVLPPVKKHRKR